MKREQEAFAARYQLVGIQEELADLAEKMKVVEQERDALRAIAKNEEVARIAAEGQIPLPTSPSDDEFASPKKVRRSISQSMIVGSATSEEELEELRINLEWAQHLANRAYDQVEFLEQESKLHHLGVVASAKSTVLIPSETAVLVATSEAEERVRISPAKKDLDSPVRETERTFARTPSCEPPAAAIPLPVIDTRASLASLLEAPMSPTPVSSPAEDTSSSPQTISSPPPSTETTLTENIAQVQVQFHTISTTTRIPIALPDNDTPDLAPLPKNLDSALSPTMSREEALAQIRERRGRARSLAQGTMTPKKQTADATIRRDISAPAARSGGMRGRSATKH